jgi:hypothetical protein
MPQALDGLRRAVQDAWLSIDVFLFTAAFCMNKLQRIIVLLWAVALGAIAMSVVAAGLLLGTRKGAGR